MDNPTRILVVDPDVAHTERLAASLQRMATAATVESCPDPDLAPARLAEATYDAVVIDLGISDDAAATVVAEIERRFPGLPLLGIATRADDRSVSEACHLGAAGLLAKPCDPEALLELLHTPAPDAGFVGSATGVPTALLLTLHCGAGADGVLHLRCEENRGRPERVGCIHLEAGQPIHASAGGQVGAEAVHAMLGWRDAETTWLPGRGRCARTIVGRWEHLLTAQVGRDAGDTADVERMVAVAYPDVVEKLSRLAQTTDVLGAFLLRHAQVVTGRCVEDIDADLANRALCRLAHVFYDVDAQPAEQAGHEIQAIVGSLRLVVDRVGPPSAGYQVGVLVRQAAPICKSLRRLLRQIDGAFGRAMNARARETTAPEMVQVA